MKISKISKIIMAVILLIAIIFCGLIYVEYAKGIKRMQEREIADSKRPKIIIHSPIGTDKIKIGSTYTIKWELKNVKEEHINNPVTIWIFSPYLEEGCEKYGSIVSCPQDRYSIVKSTPNSGNFSWSVSSEIKPGKYKMEIFSATSKTGGYAGISEDYFQIER